jgi:hypothetical protein
MTGIVTGGWEYVAAAYGITFLVLAGYAATLIARVGGRKARQEDPR